MQRRKETNGEDGRDDRGDGGDDGVERTCDSGDDVTHNDSAAHERRVSKVRINDLSQTVISVRRGQRIR